MITLRIRLNPGSSRVGCWRDMQHGLVCAVREQPVDGKANKALVVLLSELLDLPKSAITIISGFTTRYKTVTIATKHSSEAVLEQLCGGADATV